MSRLARLAVLAAVLPCAGTAAVLDDFLARGYRIAAATVLPGSFTGCVRQHRLVFADGSILACARTAAQTAFEPRVYLLRLGGDPPSVALVGSHVMAGELLRLKLHDYPVPLRLNPDPLFETRTLPASALQPLGAVPSIDTVTRQQNAPVSQQQDRLPLRPRMSRSSR